MGKVKVRYLVSKLRGKKLLHYWQPNKDLRNAGFLTMRLPDKLDDAIIKAESLNAQVDEWRKGIVSVFWLDGTVGWLAEQYKQDEVFLELAPRTQSDYMKHLDKLVQWAGKYRATDITPKVVKGYYRERVKDIGLRQAKYRIQVLRSLMKFAESENVITVNPVKALSMKNPPPRTQIWEEAEITSLLKAADEAGDRETRRGVILALHCGQRPSDTLNMKLTQYNGTHIQVRQRKTSAYVSIKCLPEVKTELDSWTPQNSVYLVPTRTGTPYSDTSFAKKLRVLREAAGIRDELQFKDFRRTAVVNLARADCTVPQIAAITGHSIAHCQAIVDTYLPRDGKVADSGIEKLEEYRRKKLEQKV